MHILGIDPSYSRTGLVLLSVADSTIVDSVSISVTKKLVYDLPESIKYANSLVREIDYFLCKQDVDIDAVSIEYPILRTPSGAYLGLIQPVLYNYFASYGCNYVLLPAQAINSYTQNKSKTKSHIVNWVKQRCQGVPKGFNHDMASAAVLAFIGHDVVQGTYKHSFYLDNRI